MAGSSSAPALAATIVFGLVVLAASTAILFFFVKASRSPLLRNELRLALSFFLSSSAIWAFIELGASLVHHPTSTCQTLILFATVFDQVARVSVEQFFLWAFNGGVKVSTMSLALQGAVLVRFVLGAIFVAVQRPQFKPVCVASNMVLPVGVIVLVVDMGMFGILATKALLAKRDNTGPARSNTLIFFTAAFGFWTGLSVPLFLGLESTGYMFRTILPAVGLLILIGIVALSTTGLVSLPTTSILNFHKGGSFESANVDMETRDLPGPPPSQGEMSSAPPVLPLIRQPSSGRGIGGLPIEGELFPPMRTQQVSFKPHSKKQMTEKAFNGGKIVISKPVITATTDTDAFDHIQTIDLAAAALRERERRDKAFPMMSFDAMLTEPLFPKSRDLTANWQTSNGKSWYVDQNSPPAQEPSFATTSAVQLSPGMDETRRRSPRHPTQAGAPSPSDDETRTPRTVPSPKSTKTLLSKDNFQEPKSATARPPFTALSAMSAFSSLTALPAVPAVPSSVDQFLVDPRIASLPRSKSVKNDIRPSRRRPETPVEVEEQKSTKTPVQRRATVGLPFNPRSRATRMFTGQRGNGNDQPIMFLNHEESSYPVYAVPEPDDNSDALSRKSVIHRPRPIPRKSIAESISSDTDSMASTAELLVTAASPIGDEFTIVSTPKLPMVSPVTVKNLSQSSLGMVAISPGSSALHKTVRRTSYVPDLPALPTEFKGQQPKIVEDVSPKGTATSIWTVAPNEHALFSLTNNDEPQSAYHNKRFSVNTQSSYEGTIGRNSVVFASDSKTAATMASYLSERLSRHESADSELSMMLRAAPLPPVAGEGGVPEVPAVPDMFKDGRTTPLSEEEEDAQEAAKELASWHRRIGEELPGFSSQLNDRRQKKLPVPKPLALTNSANVTVVVEAEPSPEEPEQEALDRIHEQLKKLEDTDARATISEKQRLDLLANLESEMGAQESQWQMLKVDLAATPSTVISTPGGVPSVRNSVDANSVGMLARARLSTGAGDLLLALQEEANRRLSTASEKTPKDEVNRRSGRMSLISVSSRTLSQIGSPTPPDTDESGADDSDYDSTADPNSAKEMPESLALGTVTGFLALDEILSSSVEEPQNQPASPAEFEEVSLPTPKATDSFVAARPEEEPKAAEPDNIRFSLADLEQLMPAPPPRPRSITRRPPRMSKRISALPDIVENPEPLAGRTGSLGIFQFAWGEKSDSATMPIRMSGLGGTMSSGRGWLTNPLPVPMLPSQALATHSFFEDEEADNVLDNYEDEDYDDGFDDSTLWEIADLLEADLEGSRDDLFVVDGEDAEIPEVAPATPVAVKKVVEVVKEQEQPPVAALWTAVKASQATRSYGLPQPTDGALEVFFAEAPRPTARAVPRMREEAASLTSSSLWEASTGASVASMMWCEHKALREVEEIKTVNVSSTVELSAPKETTVDATCPATLAVISSLWSPAPIARSTVGLPQPDVQTWNAYIALPTRSIQRKATVQESDKIKSTSLWQPSTAAVSPSGGVWAPKTLSAKPAPQPLTVSSKVVRNLLWSSSPAKAVSFGLPQPEASVWTAYLVPEGRSHRGAYVPTDVYITSTSLWAPAMKTRSEGLWMSKSKPSAALSVKPSPQPLLVPAKVAKDLLWSSTPAKTLSFGLPQPEASVWTAYLVPEGRNHRGAYVPTDVFITSTTLWAPTVKVQSEGMWMSKSKPSVTQEKPQHAVKSAADLLWELPVTTKASFGLPQPEAHVWATYLVPEGGNHRGAYVPTVVTITSTSLWSPTVETQPKGMWLPKSKPQTGVKRAVGSLWAPAVTTEAFFGLPQPEAHVWATYLVSEGRNHRSAYVPTVVTITSTSLWSPAIEAQTDGMWMPKSKLPAAQKLPEVQEKSQPIVKESAGLLWALPVTTDVSFGLPQPDAKIWESYIPHMTSASLRRVLISEPASIESRALWSLPPKKEAASGFLWCSAKSQIEKPQPTVQKPAGSLWTLQTTTEVSLGLPQPDTKSWKSYTPRTGSTSLRRVIISEPASIESLALWALPPKEEATSGLLWRSTQVQADEQRAVPQQPIRSTAEAVEILLQPAAARTAHVRSSTAVLITKEQWNSAFKEISQPQTQAPAELKNRPARSKSVKSRAFFDPAVMALIAELPSPTTFTPPSSQRPGVGRSKSVSFLPPTRRPSHSASSSFPEAGVRPFDFI